METSPGVLTTRQVGASDEFKVVRIEVIVLVNPSLTKGSVEFLILSILEEGESHGYQITKQIQERSMRILTFRRSSIYPVLARMEDRGWISRRWANENRRRCFYRLTDEGNEALDRHRVEWKVFTTGVNLVVGSNGS